MFIELIATFLAGFGTAGVVLLANRLLGGRLPRPLMPIAAGAAMIAFTIYSEYDWFTRTQASLPEGFVIVTQNESRAAYRPWTYVRPFVDRFAAVQPAAARTNPALPDQVMADVYLFGRWQQVARVPVLLDCAGSRRADLIDGMEFDATGAVIGATWIDLATDDPVLQALCPAD